LPKVAGFPIFKPSAIPANNLLYKIIARANTAAMGGIVVSLPSTAYLCGTLPQFATLLWQSISMP